MKREGEREDDSVELSVVGEEMIIDMRRETTAGTKNMDPKAKRSAVTTDGCNMACNCFVTIVLYP